MMRGAMMTLAAMLALPAAAQETQVAAEGHVPPPATIADAAWLVGDWAGAGIAGAPAAESWLPPAGGTMVGVFVQQQHQGGLMFTEHMQIAEEEGSLVLRLKHFNPDLTGWEEKDEMVRFRLIAAEPCLLRFSALTYRCDGEGGLIVAVRMQGEGETFTEQVFRFARREKTAAAEPTP
ncbi:DUF6265 family protein [Pelagerythrobacter marinus]|uniref:DUF6265 family protein n=1 Tax=Pelagerythrobacter marinus TaxID=538382 RepID=UPI00192705A6|nr:DUF6265 family protein [Pelagerythrobacter marinus]